MSVQIIENWTNIVGVLKDSQRNETLNGFLTLEIEVTQAHPIEGFANLLADAAGQTIHVNARVELAENFQLTPGAIVNCRVRRGGANSLFMHPEHFSVNAK